MLEAERQRFLQQLLTTRNEFIGRHQRVLLQALHPGDVVEAAIA